MLVLSRKTSEGIVIDGDIRVHILKIQGKTIRIGIEAPEQISIRRFELEPLARCADPPSACAEVACLSLESA